MRILNPEQSYTFSKIFELQAEVDEVVADFGYSFSRKLLDLPQYSGKLDRLDELRDRIVEILPYVSLRNEAARREIIISRIVTELVHYTHAQLRIEYPLKVSEQLQGYLDYFLQTQTNMLVVEAKREDLTNGFTQLAVELIALDRWLETQEQPILFGAVSTGSIWQFGRLHRAEKHIEQGLNTYRVPEDIESVMRILTQSLVSS